jgi:hypothetical protein
LSKTISVFPGDDKRPSGNQTKRAEEEAEIEIRHAALVDEAKRAEAEAKRLEAFEASLRRRGLASQAQMGETLAKLQAAQAESIRLQSRLAEEGAEIARSERKKAAKRQRYETARQRYEAVRAAITGLTAKKAGVYSPEMPKRVRKRAAPKRLSERKRSTGGFGTEFTGKRIHK